MSDSRGPVEPSPVAGGPSEAAHLLLEHVEWSTLEHADGPADDIPAALRDLTHEVPAVRADALRYLERINHSNSVYTATAPAARYLAAILDHPRTVPTIHARYPAYRTESRSLRAVLLDWLGDLANDVGDQTAAAARRHGFPIDDEPEVIELRAARPVIFAAVVPFLSDPDPDTHRSALTAAAALTDAPELHAHRAGLIPPLLNLLATCPSAYHRARARWALIHWGYDRAAMVEHPAADTDATGTRFAPSPWDSQPPL